MIKGVIFDLDGTLLDTIEDLTDSMNAALAHMGLPGRSLDECRNLVGDGLDTFVRRALPEGVREDPAAATRLKELMRREYRLRSRDKTRPYAGIPELLDELARRGARQAILSNKPDDSTRAIVRHFFPGRKFEPVFGARDGVPVKPDPAGALEIARSWGLAPAEIAYLGDTNTDMLTATAAGMFACGALWGFRTAAELAANGANVLLAKPADLLGFIG
ncbi:MAG: HAD family hydrolase [Candidatus Aminicenantes bacterium]|nr:MAG: HAD family hydrolase [Candidatus Aminicenantes bacterium]